MKRIVFALAIFVVFSNFVFADNAKKINSFCGIKFGSTPLKKHSFISRTKSGSRLYNFKPQKYFMNFKECGYAATPFTNKIAMVFLICRVKGVDDAENYANHVKNVLENHYKVTPKKNIRSLEPEYIFELGNIALTLKVEFDVIESTVQIVAVDVELFKLMQKEEKQYMTRNIDTSAL